MNFYFYVSYFKITEKLKYVSSFKEIDLNQRSGLLMSWLNEMLIDVFLCMCAYYLAATNY